MPDFSTTLAADCLEPDEVIHVASNTGARVVYPWRAVIESEAVYVTGGVIVGEVLTVNDAVSDGLTWSVRRGADDTDPAVHLAGTTLTALRRGEYTTDEPVIEDGSVPPVAVSTEDETDWVRTDPEVTGV